MDKKIKLIYTGAFTFVFLMIVSLLLFSNFVFAGSINPEDEREIGYEFLDDNSVVHIWNTQDDYFFEKDAGIQLTNHYEDYWTKNIFCIGYYNNDEWNKIACADELTNFEKSIETDNFSYVNITMHKDIEYNDYNLRLGINYFLRLNDKNLSITIYGKNNGIDIPFDLGFAWKVTNLDVPSSETIDKISINNTHYGLDGTYDLTFKNMTRKITHTNWNETCLEECDMMDYGCQNLCIINQTYSYEPIPFYKIYDYDGGLTGKENFLRIDWNEDLNYAVKMYGDRNQNNFYTALLINAGHFNAGQEKSTTFYWIDALTDGLISYWKLDDNLATTNVIEELDNFNGTLNGGDNTEDLSVAGKINIALDFNGVDDYISTANIGITGASSWTLSWWAVDDVVAATENMMSIGNAADRNLIGICVDGISERGILLNYWSGTYNHYLDIDGLNVSDGFHHYLLTYDGTNVRLYINNDLKFTDPITLNIIDAPVRIGGRTGGYDGQYFNGTIDEAGIWNRVLTSDERTGLWNNGNGLAYPLLILTCTFAGYVFDENSNALEGANVTVFNQFDITEYYEDTTDSNGYWAVNITNSTNTYMVSAYFNNTLIGQLKPYISGTC